MAAGLVCCKEARNAWQCYSDITDRLEVFSEAQRVYCCIPATVNALG